jgi:hypothetical protein
MLFLSEQLPDANYSPKHNKNTEKNKNNNTINNTTKSTKNSLPNITSNSHYNATNEENTSESSNKMLNKYNIVENSLKFMEFQHTTIILYKKKLKMRIKIS